MITGLISAPEAHRYKECVILLLLFSDTLLLTVCTTSGHGVVFNPAPTSVLAAKG